MIKRNWMRSIAAIAAAAALAAGTPSPAASAPEPIYTHAKAAALIDVESGRILYSQHGDEPMRIASLTKIMTAIVAIEHGKLDSVATVSRRAAGKEGSSIYLKVGEKMTLHHLLYGLMLRSGNDAATAIAEHVGGSEEGFVYLMNETAERLGLANSRFRNPHGLDEEGHYSSANDLARLTAYALKNPVFSEIVGTKRKTAPNPYDPWDYVWTNKNKMLAMYEGADGVKTGYTKKALRCLVSSATRNGQRLAAVTLNDGNDWEDHRKLLDWGFAHYPLQTVVKQGERIAGFAVVPGRTFRYPLAEGERELLRSKLTLADPNGVRFALGERGTLEWYLGDVRIGSVPVYDPGSVRLRSGRTHQATAAAGAGEAPAWSDAVKAVAVQLFRH
ncbi:D-alanyl-D-alanine carboxypeptidase family protein [Paenibacillus cisolokensis]|uniref:D-alanyl-D-alanine carboxypeptidase family protein n=1 Tax=Paenibacillus cisolokensis TaxID=1658519 RepID=UPI003D2E8504